MKEQPVIHSNPNILGGALVFVGTRVPVQTLLDYLEGGESLDTFLDHFPTVRRDQALTVLELVKAQSEDIRWALRLKSEAHSED
jgi:uncharacterized protein (DUF433 family)